MGVESDLSTSSAELDLSTVRSVDEIRADLARCGPLVSSLTGSVDTARMRLLNDVAPLLDALAAKEAELATAQAKAWPEWSQMLTNQACENGKHPDWFVDSEHSHRCPWCERDAALRRIEAQDAQLRRVRNAHCWMNSDGEHYVLADDLSAALDAQPEPAREETR